MKRVFLLVLDSLGIGQMPDGEQFGDVGVDTLAACAKSPHLHIPNLLKAGLGNVDGVTCLPKTHMPTAAFARLKEASRGKDTTIGHWEIAGVVSETPLPTYPNGFPREIIEPFCRLTGRGVLANAPWSGTAVIEEYGAAHMQTGDLIVYTSADSVFQIAAHEDIVPPEQLYAYCRMARELLQGKHGVGRVIARPFVGAPGQFRRTANRHDFSLTPPKETLLDALEKAGLATIGVGKIQDIFAGRGIGEYVYTKDNADGLEKTAAYARRDFTGLCFVNLVDFDMHFGHRRDVNGYARALSEFDVWLGQFLPTLGQEDVVILTADHGCDPSYAASTDHTREYVPLLIMGKGIKPINLGTRESFADIAATVADIFGVDYQTPGKSFWNRL